MKEMKIALVLAEATIMEQIGGKHDICFQGTRISGILFDKEVSSELLTS